MVIWSIILSMIRSFNHTTHWTLGVDLPTIYLYEYSVVRTFDHSIIKLSHITILQSFDHLTIKFLNLLPIRLFETLSFGFFIGLIIRPCIHSIFWLFDNLFYNSLDNIFHDLTMWRCKGITIRSCNNPIG